MLLESELEPLLELLELLLVLREFVATVPSGVCSSTRSANLTFLAGSGTGSPSPVLASGGVVGLAQSVLSDSGCRQRSCA